MADFFSEICPRKHINYGKSSKILLVHRQTAQPQIRLPLKKQSDPGYPCLLFRHVVSSSPSNQHFSVNRNLLEHYFRTTHPILHYTAIIKSDIFGLRINNLWVRISGDTLK